MNQSSMVNGRPGLPRRRVIKSVTVVLLVIVIVMATSAGASVLQVASILGIVISVLSVADRTCSAAPPVVGCRSGDCR